MSERCRDTKFGRCERHRGHRAEPGDSGHEIYFDGTCSFRWGPDGVGFWSLTEGMWIRELAARMYGRTA